MFKLFFIEEIVNITIYMIKFIVPLVSLIKKPLNYYKKIQINLNNEFN